MRFSIASKEMHYTKFGKTPRVQKTTEFQILDKATEWDGQNEKYRIQILIVNIEIIYLIIK